MYPRLESNQHVQKRTLGPQPSTSTNSVTWVILVEYSLAFFAKKRKKKTFHQRRRKDNRN